MTGPPSPIRLLIADDQDIVLDGLEALLGQDAGVRVVGRAGSGQEAVELARELRPDVVLMDISMPGMDGIEATRETIKACGDCRVLVLSMYGTCDMVREVLAAGASGYLLKNTGKDELWEAIRVVASGSRYLAAALTEGVAQETADSPGMVQRGLTRREKEIVRLIAQEMNTPAIAERLSLSPGTVETHRKNIMHKLGVRNAAGLVRYALERGWTGPNEDVAP